MTDRPWLPPMPDRRVRSVPYSPERRSLNTWQLLLTRDLSGLPEIQRVLLEDRAKGYEVDALAERHNLSKYLVMSHLARARHALKDAPLRKEAP